ncbi:hypothetical protein Ga0074812_14716 [Parafrankia irregularis]|uniref:Uncharacterized protein n=1 Tax=Parafrankia irregularis TaxID=795642 RepID=A0A0S4R0P3_9ACTN|nr:MULTISPECIES: hypothetical protein [Parafrankia]MBE3206667.1 hypothetical protein [Parafrankia sp. CH37]CUU60770.1 hypothetical protein Ga0074812_14716 [Parafrankia irregularis]
MIQELMARGTLLLADTQVPATQSPGTGGGGAPTQRDPLGPVNPSLTDLPPQGAEALQRILGWAMYGAVTACGIAALVSAGFTGWARMTARPQHFDRGLTAFVWAVGCGFLVGIAIPLVNSFYNLAI